MKMKHLLMPISIGLFSSMIIVLLIFLSINMLVPQQIDALKYPAVEGTVFSSEMTIDKGGESTSYNVLVTYDYVVVVECQDIDNGMMCQHIANKVL